MKLRCAVILVGVAASACSTRSDEEGQGNRDFVFGPLHALAAKGVATEATLPREQDPTELVHEMDPIAEDGEEENLDEDADIALGAGRPEATVLPAAFQLLSAGDYPGAIKAAREALKANPQHLNSRLWLAEALLRKGRLDEAEDLLDRMSAVAEPRVRNLQGIIAYRDGRPQDAAHFFQAARDADPEFWIAALNLGLLYLEYYRFPEATEQLDAVLEIEPTNDDARMHRAVLRRIAGELEQATPTFELLAEKHGGNPVVQHNLAAFYLHEGEMEAAQDAIREAVEMAPEAAVHQAFAEKIEGRLAIDP